MKEKPTLVQRLKEGYEVAKKPIAYIMMLIAIAVQTVPSELLPHTAKSITYPVVLIATALILLQVLFEIYEEVRKDEKQLNIIESNDLYAEILDIVKNEKTVNIRFIGVAGRHGWTNVLDKLLNENNPDSLIANRSRFNIELALLDPKFLERNEDLFHRFQGLTSIINSIERTASDIERNYADSAVALYLYAYMPNLLGFLINDNYLFVTNTYWEHVHSELSLRAGGSGYFVYDKNDEFGGQEVIRRFSGWFEYIKSLSAREGGTIQAVS